MVAFSPDAFGPGFFTSPPLPTTGAFAAGAFTDAFALTRSLTFTSASGVTLGGPLLYLDTSSTATIEAPLDAHFGADNPFTVMAWAVIGDAGTVFGLRNAAGTQSLSVLSVAGDTVHAMVESGAVVSHTHQPGWSHLALAYDPSASPRLRLLVDGTLVATGNGVYAPPSATPTMTTRIAGTRPAGVPEFSEATMADLRTYNVALPNEHVAEIARNRASLTETGGLMTHALDEVTPFPPCTTALPVLFRRFTRATSPANSHATMISAQGALEFEAAVDNMNIPSQNLFDNICFYFETRFLCRVPGTYTFGIDGDDRVEIEVNGVVVAWRYTGGGFTNAYTGTQSGTIFLDRGVHRIVVRHVEFSSGEGVRAAFIEPGGSTFKIITVANIAPFGALLAPLKPRVTANGVAVANEFIENANIPTIQRYDAAHRWLIRSEYDERSL